ncbi:MAG: hypothetical protein ACI9UK_001512 [Candidatus Krumholzibacteriia bacterium]
MAHRLGWAICAAALAFEELTNRQIGLEMVQLEFGRSLRKPKIFSTGPKNWSAAHKNW